MIILSNRKVAVPRSTRSGRLPHSLLVLTRVLRRSRDSLPLLLILAFVFLVIAPISIRAQEQALIIIGRTVLRVDPERSRFWTFEVPVYVRNGLIVGSVEAAAGAGNDIRVLILTEPPSNSVTPSPAPCCLGMPPFSMSRSKADGGGQRSCFASTADGSPPTRRQSGNHPQPRRNSVSESVGLKVGKFAYSFSLQGQGETSRSS